MRLDLHDSPPGFMVNFGSGQGIRYPEISVGAHLICVLIFTIHLLGSWSISGAGKASLASRDLGRACFDTRLDLHDDCLLNPYDVTADNYHAACAAHLGYEITVWGCIT